ncbi:MAG: asparagine synthetase B, partial [Clostridia bacterium]|nr:asparagine synthetase B [Clostridia bacterium]
MCSIMTCYSSSVSPDAFRAGFERTKSRGPDDSRILERDGIRMAFHRLSIMGLSPKGMQPFERGGSLLVCNGEIYGFRTLRDELRERGYTFESDSDCEILLPLWFEYGADMFPLLDAEFACVLYDAKTGTLVAARDPIGIRPLFYGYGPDGKILFASEAKNLVGLTEQIVPFPPGCYWMGGAFVRYSDIARPSRTI